jgi:pimeloyl-ACP methyl ester carboxylesterase
MLLEHRNRIDRLALAAAGGLGREVGPALRLATLKAAGPFLESPLFSAGTRLIVHWASRSFAVREAHETERLARLNAAPNSGLAFRKTVSACIGLRGQHMQTWHHIHKVEALPPLALFWGERDTVIPVRHAHATVRRLENATVTVYRRCGHALHLQAPLHFSEDLQKFLQDEKRMPARLLPESEASKHFRIRNRRTMNAQSARAA